MTKYAVTIHFVSGNNVWHAFKDKNDRDLFIKNFNSFFRKRFLILDSHIINVHTITYVFFNHYNTSDSTSFTLHPENISSLG
jgi:hypothetical protein